MTKRCHVEHNLCKIRFVNKQNECVRIRLQSSVMLSAFAVILFACASSFTLAQHVISNYCVNESTLVYDYENEPSIVGTFVNCLRTVQDAMIAPYYDLGSRINVSTEVFLNNLISIDEVSSTVTIDFFFKTYWVVRPFLFFCIIALSLSHL